MSNILVTAVFNRCRTVAASREKSTVAEPVVVAVVKRVPSYLDIAIRDR
jgi:hypothetical protein